jgi:hypothetical protein
MRIIFLRQVQLFAIIRTRPLQRLMPDREKEPLARLPMRFQAWARQRTISTAAEIQPA